MWDLGAAVAVDVLRIHKAVGPAGFGNPRGAVHGEIDERTVTADKEIGYKIAGRERGLRKQRGRIPGKLYYAQPLQRGDIRAECRRRCLRLLPEREGVLVDKIGRAVRRAQIQKLVAPVAVDVAGDKFGAVGAQKRIAAPPGERIYAQYRHARGDLPRDEKLLPSVAGEIGTVDPPDGRPLTGEGKDEPVFAVFGIVDIDPGDF